MSILRWLIYKDLSRFLADRQGALMALLVPVVLASLLGMLFAPSTTTGKIAMANPGELSGYNSYAQNFAGMLVLFLLFTGQGEAKNLHGERSRGSLMRLQMSRAQPWQILLGSGLSVAIIALVVSLLVYLVGMLVFGVSIRGSLLGFGAMLIAQALFVGGFSLLLAGLGRTEQQIGSVGTFVILVLAFAGGATIPSFLMPDWLQLVGHALPTYWATRGLAAMTWRALPLGEGLLAASMLTGFGVLCALVGMWRFRWE